MSRCPFLSTSDRKVSCFQECPFNQCEEAEGSCPFKSLSNYTVLRKNLFQSYNSLEDSNINILEDMYQHDNYTRFF